MKIVDPANELGNLYRGDVEVDHEPLLSAARHHAVKLELVARVDLLMRDIGRHVNGVSRPSLGDELQMIAPAHSSHAIDHVDDALEIAMVVRPRLRPGIDRDGSGPEPGGAGLPGGHGRTPPHAERLGGRIVELVRANDADAIRTPAPGISAHGLISWPDAA